MQLRALRINLSVMLTAATRADALQTAADRRPDVVVLDLGLPDMFSIDVLAGLRGWLSAPVIVLSARSDSADKVEALDADTDESVVETSSFTVDLTAKTVTRNGAEVLPTLTEWRMLEMLVRNRRKLGRPGAPAHRSRHRLPPPRVTTCDPRDIIPDCDRRRANDPE
jgi:two-component system KDP operon response regulator KdpE